MLARNTGPIDMHLRTAGRIIVTVLVTFFPLVVSSVAGLLATPPELLELTRSCRATRL